MEWDLEVAVDYLRDGVEALGDASEVLATEDPATHRADAMAELLVELRRNVDHLEREWLRWLGAFDAGGYAQGEGAASTADWLRAQCGMSAQEANRWVIGARTVARASMRQQAAC